MPKEYEYRFKDYNKKEILTKLKELGAKYFGTFKFRVMVFTDQNNSEKYIRIRDEGYRVTMTIKNNLTDKFPSENEVYLTKIKSKIVNRRTLGDIGHEMELSNIMNYNNSRSIKLETIEGNAFEALIGAIYLDGGYRKAQESIEKHIFKKYLNLNQLLEEELDFKSKLFIWCQKNKLDIQFEVVSEENFGHEWKYVVEVIINEKSYGRGTGSSKKKAEQVASKETFELLGAI